MREFDLGCAVLCEYDEDGFPIVQTDAYGEEDSGIPGVELHHFWGFLGMPHPGERDPGGEANPEKSAMVLRAWQGNQGHAFPLGDPRTIVKIPQAGPGGSVHYGGKKEQPAFSFFEGATGSYQLYVPYAFSGDAPGKACAIGIDVREAGKASIEIVHGEGMSITILEGGKNSIVIKNKAGDAYIEVNDDGVTINGNLKVNGDIDFGKSPAALALAHAEPLEALLTALDTAVTAIAKPGSETAVTAFKASTAALKPLIASTTTKAM